MKTVDEMLNFYNIEIGKKYIITKAYNKTFKNLEGKEFEIKKDELSLGNLSVFFIISDSIPIGLSCLSQFDYKEVESEILNEREKIYLKTIIEPFRDRIKYIKVIHKNTISGIDIPTLFFGLYNNDVAYLPEFSQYGWFENMENYKCYSLEELKL